VALVIHIASAVEVSPLSDDERQGAAARLAGCGR
jgi:hypothetical protein